MALTVCTTFPNEAWDLYARAGLESFARFWPPEVRLHLYLDDDTLTGPCADTLRPCSNEIHVGKLPAHDAFLARNSAGESRDMRFAACRFSHKVAALKATFDRSQTDPESHVLWLDADVIATAPITHDWLAQFLPTGPAHVSYLGRARFPFSECGFVGYRLSEQGRAFIDAFWSVYESDALFKLPQWHDSFVFDRIRETFDQTWSMDISKGAPGVHVWLNTPLAERLEHWKGPVAKRLRRPITDGEALAMARAARDPLKS